VASQQPQDTHLNYRGTSLSSAQHEKPLTSERLLLLFGISSACCSPTPRALWHHAPPWMQPRSKLMVSSVNSHTKATIIGWHLREIP
jgi:hypothetical protein